MSNNNNEKLVIQWIKESISPHSKSPPFDYIIDKIVVYLSQPSHSISEFKRRSKKNKGDLFEILAKIYLQYKYKDCQVWLLNEVPDEDRKIIGLKKNDYGIDLIVKHSSSGARKNKYSAVQCKYRNRSNRSYKLYKYMKYPNKNVLTWKQLSTFYALCARLEESNFVWHKLIVFTNCDYVKRLHTKKENDLTIAYKTLINLKTWKDIVKNMNEQREENKEREEENNESEQGRNEEKKEKDNKVRELRMKYYEKCEKFEKSEKCKDYTLDEIEKEFNDYRPRRLERIMKIRKE
jgi:hypothetical protein